MSSIRNQSGFGHVVFILFVFAVLVIGFSAYSVYNANQKASNAAATNTFTASTSAANTTVPTAIKSKSDLQQAAAALNASGGQAQSQLNSTSLNSSISDML
jgi:hypothetical protein